MTEKPREALPTEAPGSGGIGAAERARSAREQRTGPGMMKPREAAPTEAPGSGGIGSAQGA